MLMRVCGSVLRGTLLKTRGLKRGLKRNRHQFHIVDLFPCMIFHFPTWNVSQLSCRSTWCTASILTWDWMVHPRFRSGGTWWLTSRAGEFSASFQLPDSQDWKGDAHVCKRPSLLKPNWGLFFLNVTKHKFLIPGGAVRRRGFCALFSLPALPHRVWFALAQLSVGAVGSGFYFLEECAVYWNVSLCKSWVVGPAP